VVAVSFGMEVVVGGANSLPPQANFFENVLYQEPAGHMRGEHLWV
jgi:hypothetical protein